jgi:S-formylglutathione hydrolase FrmB
LFHEIEHQQRRGPTVTGLSAGGGGAFTLAHSSTMSAAWALIVPAANTTAAAIAAGKFRFMKILPNATRH